MVPYFEVLIIRILLFRVLYWGPLFSETPICRLPVDLWLLLEVYRVVSISIRAGSWVVIGIGL